MAVKGKLIYIKVGEKEIECQTDLTLTFTANTEEEEACKPLSTETSTESEWIERSISSREWSADVSAQTLANNIATYNNIPDLIGVFVDGSLAVEVAVQTNAAHDDYDEDATFIFTGSALMTGLTLNAPQAGASTGDVSFVSTGKPTWTKTAVPPAD